MCTLSLIVNDDTKSSRTKTLSRVMPDKDEIKAEVAIC